MTTFFTDNSSKELWTALGVALGLLLLFSLIRIFCTRRQKTGNSIFVRLGAKLSPFSIFFLAICSPAFFLLLSDHLQALIRYLFFSALIVQLAIWGGLLVDFFLERSLDKLPAEERRKRASNHGLAWLARLGIAGLATLTLLEAIPGFSVSQLLTGLGVGGIAIGLAAQSLVSDLLANLSIRTDKPFAEGQMIKTGEFSGTVEKIGLKSTHLRSLNGEMLVISNSQLLASPLQNFSDIQERRVVLPLLLDYATPAKELSHLPDFIAQSLQGIVNLRFDSCVLSEFAPTGLKYEVVFYISGADYKAFLEAKQTACLMIISTMQIDGYRFGKLAQAVQIENGDCN